jgi:hypothetical protein
MTSTASHNSTTSLTNTLNTSAFRFDSAVRACSVILSPKDFEVGGLFRDTFVLEVFGICMF